MMSKPTINYWLDLLIGVAFIASAISGVVFLLPFPLESVLGLSYAHWDTIHTWGSLLMIGGVIAPSGAALEMADAHDAQNAAVRCPHTPTCAASRRGG
jgi:hypothetical protein